MCACQHFSSGMFSFTTRRQKQIFFNCMLFDSNILFTVILVLCVCVSGTLRYTTVIIVSFS